MSERGARKREAGGAGAESSDILARVLSIQPGGVDWSDLGAKSPLKRIQEAMATSMADASARFDQLKHIVAEPEAAAAQLVGTMVSKDYGVHERPHTEHHLYRDRGGPRAVARDPAPPPPADEGPQEPRADAGANE